MPAQPPVNAGLFGAVRTPPRAILFDAGLTLIHADGDVLLEELARDGLGAGLSARTAVTALVLAAEARHLPLPVTLDGTDKVVRSCALHLGLDPLLAAPSLRRALEREDLYRVLDPEARETLRALRAQGITIGVISNSAGTVRDDLERYGLLEYTDAVFDSTHVGVEKPDPSIFHQALDELGLDGGDCWYVGDGLINDVLGALGAGFALGILYDPFGAGGHLPAVPRITRLTELVGWTGRSTAGQEAGRHDSATSSADALAVLWDPEARASKPLWEFTVPLARAVLSGLREAADRAGLRSGLEHTLTGFSITPAAPGARAALLGRILQVLSVCGPTPSLDAALKEFGSTAAARLVTGEEWKPDHEATEPAPVRTPRSRSTEGGWDLTVVVDFRALPHEVARLRNVRAVLRALSDQTLARDAYRVIVVEQDARPRNRPAVEDWADAYVHASNAGPYNRSWSHNVGAVQVAGRSRVLCFLDADVLPPRDLLERIADAVTDVTPAVLAYERVVCLDEGSTRAVLVDRFSGEAAPRPERLRGYHLHPTFGGCVAVTDTLFHRISGFDESFEGWGDEDNDFYHRAAAHGHDRLTGTLYHLHHGRPDMERPPVDVVRRERAPVAVIGSPDLYAETTP
ncbi:HAD-IA family hydrolase [Streptomyces sp. NPDC091287]|uniref:HAD-IA family hydrolase n=1 Tax=Streptomyces sp. NPDC091287 TaxID=3365988 RepID=UPI0037F657E6